MKVLGFTACLLGLCLASPDTSAQLSAGMMPRPMTSPRAGATQRIGLTDVTLSYHRPGAKGREIWGGIVDYDQVWRCGANENTTISFSDAVRVQGVEVPAGTYGLHAIPTRGDWSIMLSTNSTAWGSYTYDPSEDAARVTVTPSAAPYQEWMGFDFVDLSDTAATLRLRWGELAVPVQITVDTPTLVLTRARDDYLRGIAQWTWEGWHQAAKYCFENQVDLDQGLVWAQRSVSIAANFDNLWLQADLAKAVGQDDAASKSYARALEVASEGQRNRFGHRLLVAGQVDRAIQLFQLNAQKNPDSWRVYESLATAYDRKGDAKLARDNFTKALALAAGDQEATSRLQDQVDRLEN